MDTPNYVAKAKALAKKALRTTALVIVPLCTAIQSQAGTVLTPATPNLPTSGLTCQTSQGTCSGGDQAIGPFNGIGGVKFFTSGSVFFDGASGGTSQLDNIYLSSSGFVPSSIPASTLIPGSYNFTLADAGRNVSADVSGGSTIENWALTFQIEDDFTGVRSAFTSGSGFGTFSGTFADITALNGSALLGNVTVTAYLSFSWTPQFTGSQVSVDVPSNSFDFGTQSQVPEPASLALVGAGLALAGIGAARRRKNNQ